MGSRARRVSLAAALAATLLGTPAARASAAVSIDSARVIVSTPGASATVTRHPFALSFQDAAGRTVLAEVPNTGQPPTALAPVPDPAPLGGRDAPSATLYAPLSFLVGGQRSVQYPGATWEGNQLAGTAGGVLYSARDVTDARPLRSGVALTVSTSDPSGRQLSVTLAPGPGATIRVAVTPTSQTGVATIADSFASAGDEAFHGFGGRHNAIDEHGQDFYDWIEQENFSAGPFQFAANALPGSGGQGYLFPNGPTAAYYVQPLFVSSRGYGFMLDQPDLSRFRLDSDRSDAWQVSAAAATLSYIVAPGAPAQATAALSAINGRQRVPPAWAAGDQFDREVRVSLTPGAGETQRSYSREVDADLANLARYHTPVDGYRIEGWPLLTRQQLKGKIAAVKRLGAHALLYFRAFASDDGAGTEDNGIFDYAVSHGYVATTASGQPYLFEGNYPGPPAALIDFTNPAAVSWWQGRIREALDLGADGFMQDFGEQVQVDMHFHDGETGATMHNRYPTIYDQATRAVTDAYEQQHPDRQIFFYTRAGYSGSPGSAAFESANFAGDESTDVSRSGGLASITTDMLNRAVGGAYGYSTDIGGYSDLNSPPTTKELFIRWAEWAALSPLFRLHGSAEAGTHTPWSYDGQTIGIYNRLSQLHEAARPLILALWRQADADGIPPTRPLWLAYPGDPAAATQDQEWMLGPDVLVAPVVAQGATSRSIYFPAGCWRDPVSGDTHQGSASQTVAAALDKLPFYFRCGTQPFDAAAVVRLALNGGHRACSAGLPYTFRVHQNNGRVTRVVVFIDGRRVRTLRGRRITSVSIRPPGRSSFLVRIVATTVRHKRVVSVRRYRGCTKGSPRTRVRRRARRRSRA